MSSAPSTLPPDGPPRRKAVLFCPECDHESPPDGDWRRRRTGGALAYVCPDCRAEVTRRTVPESPGVGVIESVNDVVTAVWRSTRHQVAAWMRSV